MVFRYIQMYKVYLFWLLFGLQNAVDFTIKHCNPDDNVFQEGSWFILRTTQVPNVPCRAEADLSLPINVEYRIKIEFDADGKSSPGLVFNNIDDDNYDMIIFRSDDYTCFEIWSLTNGALSQTDTENNCIPFRIDSPDTFQVDLHIEGRTLHIDISSGGLTRSLDNILSHPQTPSVGVIQGPKYVSECSTSSNECEVKFRILDLVPVSDGQHFTTERGALTTPQTANNELILLRIDLSQHGYLRDKYCHIAFYHKSINLQTSTLYIQDDVDHEEGTVKMYFTKDNKLDIYYISPTSQDSFTIDYHVFGCGIDQQDLSFVCERGHHFERENDYYRSTGYTSTHGSSHSDHDLLMGFYTFNGCTGMHMPTAPPGQPDVCGTQQPIWRRLNENAKVDGFTDGTACVNDGNDDCAAHWQLPSIECSNGVQLYYLVPTPTESGYCVGDKIRCDPNLNLTSIDGSGCSPCAESHFPGMKAPVFGSWTAKDGGRYDLSCMLRPEQTGLELEFEAKFMIVYPTHRDEIHSIGSTSETEVFLPLTVIRREHLQNEVICEARAKYKQGEAFGPWKESDPFYIGLKIENSDENIKVGESRAIIVALTIPIVCDGNNCLDVDDTNCYTDLYLISSTQNMDRQPCHNVLYFEPELITTMSCKRTFRCQHWNEKQYFSIQAKDTKQSGLPSHSHNVYAVTKDENRNMFNNLVDEVKIHTEVDEGIGGASKSTCKSHNDPHMTTFGETLYDIHDEPGEYVVYQSAPSDDPNMNILVTADYQTCGVDYLSHLLCNSKVGVRVNNEAVVYDISDPDPFRYMGPGHGEPGFKIVASNNHEKIEFRLPRGDRIIVLPSQTSYYNRNPSVNIDVETPNEKQTHINGNGLCGKLGGAFVISNCYELILRNGDWYQHDPMDPGRCPAEREKAPGFSNDWKALPVEKIIYATDIMDINANVSLNTVSCGVFDINDFLSHEGEWIFREALPIEHCYPYSGNNEMDRLRENARQSVNTGRQRTEQKIRFTRKDSKLSPAQASNQQSTWTSESASEYCRKNIGLSSVANTCNITNPNDVEYAAGECALDIMLTGDTNWVQGTLSSLREACTFSLYNNISLWTSGDEGNSSDLKPPTELTDNLCPDDCSGHGDCIDGHCQCYTGYSKYDCSHDVTIAPTTYGVLDDGICYTYECYDITVLGAGIIASEKLTCYYRELQEQHSTDVVKSTSGKMMNFNTVACPLPEISQTAEGFQKYLVSISNDGVLQSEAFEAAVVMAKCVSCYVSDTDSIHCALEANSCLIRGLCVLEGELSTEDECLYCNPEETPGEWSSSPGCGSSNTLVIAASVCSVVLGIVVVTAIGIYVRSRKRSSVGPSKTDQSTETSSNTEEESEQ